MDHSKVEQAHCRKAQAPSPAAIHGFAPICGPQARVLVLGSMPSVRSLSEQQYYGHPQNRFWPLMGRLFDFDAKQAYAQRVRLVQERGVAIWDVLASCRREGSLDSAIERDSEVANPIPQLLTEHPGIQLIALNGGAAAKLFKRHIAPQLDRTKHEILALPSTSPANARWSLAALQEEWAALTPKD